MDVLEGTLIRKLLRRINELEDIVQFLEGKLFALNAKVEDTLIEDSFDVAESPTVLDLVWDFSTPKKWHLLLVIVLDFV